MGDGDVSAVTLGAKSSSLSSSSVYAVATGHAQVRLDPSALDRLSSPKTTSLKHTFSLPDFLTLEQSRASLVVLLNKLLLSNSPSTLPLLISQSLNSIPNTFRFQDADVTDDVLFILNNASSSSIAIAAILDRQFAAFSAFADVAAAFSCEASKADVSAFSLMDSGDGHTSKEEVGVAADMRVLLNGSKLVGKDKARSVAGTPKLHGTMREQVKALHSKMRVELNSGVKLGESEVGSEKAVCTVLFSLAATLRDLGEGSFARAQCNLECVGGGDLKSVLGELFGKGCPTDASLSTGFNVALKLFSEREYDKFAHEVSVLLALVWKMVAWEAVTAIAALEAAELNEKILGVQGNGETLKVEKKKKKVVLGKGTSSILVLIKERLQSERLVSLETWVAEFLSFLDLAKPEFNDFLLKVKDIVESNESRRLPKIPKVMLSGFCY